MKKIDLKVGMFVKTKNGNIYVVMPDGYLCSDGGYMELGDYYQDLTCNHIGTIHSPFDIIEVRNWGSERLGLGLFKSYNNQEVLWKREDDEDLIVPTQRIERNTRTVNVKESIADSIIESYIKKDWLLVENETHPFLDKTVVLTFEK